ncbi:MULTISPECIES: hypothetical protein [Methylobacterium]|jgi:hypothetical protein|uniref:Uncharacterized protein n=1 Tax=Methylobacterium jeotgali TaxID=381630 RepID=A0ABQ4SY49_9HYPH|nr:MULTISPECIES: hypothetical protein [Methylobacterium]PIU05684.1 MAG: hypothetical protein COT56_13650 [Methylobacterium sp. CG09_land_8_20_14_0_10_71_15]PIU12394.1 MAG: hypothetical protein COT28_15495 [Methylobacterium sp. CG08_land_8_20_14_0_20_71_15]GBU16906.1 hypothetical protein AwMethylo_11210 [Methylobacterium sp.]GJE06860.1 hypothetical protein AOPFMNJM_2182 [Methylobacterium jeotgali]
MARSITEHEAGDRLPLVRALTEIAWVNLQASWDAPSPRVEAILLTKSRTADEAARGVLFDRLDQLSPAHRELVGACTKEITP